MHLPDLLALALPIKNNASVSKDDKISNYCLRNKRAACRLAVRRYEPKQPHSAAHSTINIDANRQMAVKGL